MTHSKFTGLIAATFTPMHSDGSLALDRVPEICRYLCTQHASGIFVGGSTGEGPSLTASERMELTTAFSESAAEAGLPVIIHVGHNSLRDAGTIAAHAEQAGVAAIGAAPPSYYPLQSTSQLVDCLEQIAEHAPSTPLYYYHIPPLTHVQLDMVELLAVSEKRLPTLAGIKFSAPTLDVLQCCVDQFGDRYNLLFGCDEMLLHGLIAGADGAVGSTYNYLGRIYHQVIQSLQKDDLAAARQHQHRAVEIVHAILRYGGQPSLKATMQLAGVNCGPPRLPLVPLSNDAMIALEQDLRSLEFFKWV